MFTLCISWAPLTQLLLLLCLYSASLFCGQKRDSFLLTSEPEWPLELMPCVKGTRWYSRTGACIISDIGILLPESSANSTHLHIWRLWSFPPQIFLPQIHRMTWEKGFEQFSQFSPLGQLGIHTAPRNLQITSDQLGLNLNGGKPTRL